MDEKSNPDAGTSIDAVAFVTLSEGLRAAFSHLGSAKLTEDQRGRWQRRLLAITDAAQRDLPRAQEQLDRYAAQWAREVGRPAEPEWDEPAGRIGL